MIKYLKDSFSFVREIQKILQAKFEICILSGSSANLLHAAQLPNPQRHEPRLNILGRFGVLELAPYERRNRSKLNTLASS